MNTKEIILPGDGLSIEKMPGHWLLAQMGKRVLRPGGIELTRKMLHGLAITPTDQIVEFAPGLGVTAQLALSKSPATYTAVEADERAAEQVQHYLSGKNQQCVIGRAEKTNLPDQSATVVYGEAMLTMQTPANKRKIIHETNRILLPSGRYGIHELCLVPDDLSDAMKEEISQALSKVIHVGARPLTVAEWKELLTDEGFTIAAVETAPMHLLEMGRILQDEGIWGATRITWNVLRTPAARKRILSMRSVFRHYQKHLAAVMIVAEK